MDFASLSCPDEDTSIARSLGLEIKPVSIRIDGIPAFINTTGIGHLLVQPEPSGHRARPGDAVLVSGAVGDHGLTIMGSREGLSFLTDVRSDSAPLNGLVRAVFAAAEAAGMPGEVHVLRDPTRGGLATTLNEIAEQSGVSIELDEQAIPVHETVRSGCSFLGLDPLYLANEGKCLCIVPEALADTVLAAMRSTPYGREAARIGTVGAERAGQVVLRQPREQRRVGAVGPGKDHQQHDPHQNEHQERCQDLCCLLQGLYPVHVWSVHHPQRL